MQTTSEVNFKQKEGLNDNTKRMSFLQWLTWKNSVRVCLFLKIYDIIINLHLYQISSFDLCQQISCPSAWPVGRACPFHLTNLLHQSILRSPDSPLSCKDSYVIFHHTSNSFVSLLLPTNASLVHCKW